MAASHRMAVYGGTFDPVHNGHVEVARRILKLFELDEVLFMPAYVAPHKMKTIVSPAFHRYAMLALATQDDEQLRISTAELEAPELPYTVETIARLREGFDEATRLLFIIGADSWSEIMTWREWERLLGLCDYIVVTRPGYELSADRVSVGTARIVDTRGIDQTKLAAHLTEDKGSRIFITDAAMLDVSATQVRAAARAGDHELLRKLVPPRVADYIEKYNLYE